MQVPQVSLAHEPAFALGRLEIRPATREVVGPEFRDVLEPRVMQVLVALARHPGEVVSREDLTLACWEGRVVGEDAINRVVSRLRRLSERDGGRSFALETITKVGYRLVESAAADTPAEPEAEPIVLTPPPAAAPPVRSAWRALRIAVVILASIAIVGAAMFWQLPGRDNDRGMIPEVRADYETARDAMERSTAEDTAHAVALLQSVVERAPRWGEAWGALALAHLGTTSYTPPEAQDGVAARARSAADRALELAPRNVDAQGVLIALVPQIGHWAEIDRLERALYARMPESRLVLGLRAVLLQSTGQLRAALALVEARELPRSPGVLGGYAALLADGGRLDEADRLIEDAARQWPRNRSIYFNRFWLNLFTGRPEKALTIIDDTAGRPTGIVPEDFALYRMLAAAFIARDKTEIEAALAGNEAAGARGRGYAQNTMRAAAAVGDLDRAFRIADRIYFDRGDPIGPLMFSEAQGQYASKMVRPVYLLFQLETALMRRDQRFVALAEALGLGAFWRETGQWPDFCMLDSGAADVCARLRADK